MSKIRTRVRAMLNIETFEREFIVQVNLGSGWATLVDGREVLRFPSKEDAAIKRAEIVSRHRKQAREAKP